MQDQITSNEKNKTKFFLIHQNGKMIDHFSFNFLKPKWIRLVEFH